MASVFEAALKARRAREAQSSGAAAGGGFSLPKLGAGTLFKELGAIPGGLLRAGASLAPGGQKSVLPDLLRGVAGSIAGTAATPFSFLGKYNPVEALGDVALGEDVVKDTFERIGERGILPALVEDIGNVALVGAPVSAALRAGSTAGRVAAAGRASEAAARVGFSEAAIGQAAKVARGAAEAGQPFRPAFKAAEIADPLLRKAGKRGAQANQAILKTGMPAAAEVTAAARRISRAELAAHPYQALGRNLIQPLARAGQERTLAEAATRGEARLASEADEAAGISARAADASGAGLQQTLPDELLPTEADEIVPAPPAAAVPEGIEPIAPRMGPAEEAGRRLAQEPVADWAKAAVARMGPGNVERLDKLGGRIDSYRSGRVRREQERFAESHRRQLLHGGAVQSAQAAAGKLLAAFDEGAAIPDAKLAEAVAAGTVTHAQAADTLVYDALERNLTQTRLLEEHIRQGADPRLGDLISQKFGNRTRLPDDLNTLIADDLLTAEAEWRTLAAEREARLFGSPIVGGKGLEDVGSDVARLTASEAKEFRAIQREFNRISGRTNMAEKEALAKAAEIVRTNDKIAVAREHARQLQENAEGQRAVVSDLARPVGLQAANRRQAFTELAANTIANDGATWDPHANRLLRPHGFLSKEELAAGDIGDKGFAVGYRGTVVPLAEFAADPVSVLDRVASELEPALLNQDAKLGTWVSDGQVYIDISQTTIDGRALSRTEAAVLGTARGEKAIFDLASGKDINLSTDADSMLVAAHHVPELYRRGSQFRRFLARAEAADRRLDEVSSDVFDSTDTPTGSTGRLTDSSDFDHLNALVMRQVLGAQQRGRYRSLDEAYGQLDIEARKTAASTPEGALLQAYLSPSFKPDQALSARLWNDVIQTLGPRSRRALKWYNEAHESIESRWRGTTVQLWDDAAGAVKNVDAADLLYSLIAVTSVQASPTSNMHTALSGVSALLDFQKMGDWPALFSKGLEEYLAAKGSGGRLTSKSAITKTELFQAIAKHVPNTTEVKDNVLAILSGKLLDEWDNEFLAERFGRPEILPDALGKKHKLDPADLDEATMRDLGGSASYAKIRNFWENLRDPANSQGVTLDRVMGQFFGLKGGSWNNKAAYKQAADATRRMAAEASAALGIEILPHQVQALLWVYTKDKVNQAHLGRIYGATTDALETLDPAAFRAGEDAISALIQSDVAGVGKKIETREVRVADEVGGPRRTETQYHGIQAGELGTLKGNWETARVKVAEALEAGDVQTAQELILKWSRGQQKRYTSAAEYVEDYFTKKSKKTLQVRGRLAEQGFLDPEFRAAVPLADDLPADITMPEALAQRFGDEVIKGLFYRSTRTGRMTMRFFETADPSTLAHESGHLLRMLLGPEDVSTLERIYGGRAGTVAFEERWADDLLRHMNTGRAPVGMEGHFAKVQAALSQWWEAFRGRFAENVDPEVADILDAYLTPRPSVAPELPGMEIDLTGKTASQIAANLPRRPGETPSQSLRRGYSAGKAVEKAESLERQAAEKILRAQRLETARTKMEEALNSGQTPVAKENARATKRATERLEKLVGKAADPSISRVPGPWKPLWGALSELLEEAKVNPALAEAMEGLPTTFPELVRYATERDFDPVHVASLTEDQIDSLMFQPVRLSSEGRGLGKVVQSGTRKTRTQAFARTRSQAALAAAQQDVVVEANTNAYIQYLDEVVSRPIVGGEIPPGWVAWDPTRTHLQTHKAPDVEGGRLARGNAAPTKMIPVAVDRSLRAYTQDYRHGMIGSVSKITNPWRALVLTWTPRWYFNNVIGNTILSAAAGANLDDWRKAIKAWRSGWTDQLSPEDKGALGLVGSFAEEFGGTPGIRGTVADAKRAAGEAKAAGEGRPTQAGAAYNTVAGKVQRLNGVVDDLARVSVYFGEIRRGRSPEQALMKAHDALVDYGNMSNFERQVIRQMVPFYAWQKGILQIVAKFPMDHPVGAAITMHLGRLNEEMQSDLPEQYQGLVGIPGTGLSLNTRGLNPFQDAGQLMTPQGVARSVNPFISTMIRNAYGAPVTGYPTHFRVDELGRAVPDTSPAEDLADVVAGVPQARALGVEGLGGYEGQPGAGIRASRFLGPALYTEEDVQRFKDRIAKSRETVSKK